MPETPTVDDKPKSTVRVYDRPADKNPLVRWIVPILAALVLLFLWLYFQFLAPRPQTAESNQNSAGSSQQATGSREEATGQ